MSQPKSLPFIVELQVNLKTLCPHCKQRIAFQLVVPGQSGDITQLIDPIVSSPAEHYT